MPNVRLTWVNNSTGHDGQIVRMGEPGGAKSDIADIGPSVEEYIALSAVEPEACFTVAAYEGGAEEESAEACVETADTGTDWDNVSIGDYVEGGVYAGIITYADSRQFRLVSALQAAEVNLRWSVNNVDTGGVDDWDGDANTQLIVGAAVSSGVAHPAAQHCRDYVADGFDDPYMPAKEEALFVYTQLEGHAEFVGSDSLFVWSSTEVTTASAHNFQVSSEYSSGQSKGATNRYTRPIRRVPV